MTDLGHEVLFGTFVTPSTADPQQAVALAQASERAGLDLVTVQDHPYQPALLDAWTLLSYLGAATSRIRLVPNVLNLPLRMPVVIARSAAGLDLLTGGRVELGLGAGAFWDAVEASGGRRLSPGESLQALEEAVGIIREVWATDRRGGVRVDGVHHRVIGAKRGPAPAHDIGIWIGGYKPRMLRLVGRLADGWLPSLPYLAGGPAELARLSALVDDGAAEAGRDPAAVRRLLNISGRFAATGSGLLTGPVDQWVEELTAIALEHGVSGFVLMADDRETVERFAADVVPAVRENVAAERGDRAPAGWDPATRPVAPPAPDGVRPTERGLAVGRHLVDVHDHLRAELAQVHDLIDQVAAGEVTAGQARSALNAMTMRQNNWTLGAYCASYCTLLAQHHSLEDTAIFPHLRRADPGLVPVVDRLEAEHVVIHEVVEAVDRALVALVEQPGRLDALRSAVDVLGETLLSHLGYEEDQLVGPLARHGFYPGQLRGPGSG